MHGTAANAPVDATPSTGSQYWGDDVSITAPSSPTVSSATTGAEAVSDEPRRSKSPRPTATAANATNKSELFIPASLPIAFPLRASHVNPGDPTQPTSTKDRSQRTRNGRDLRPCSDLIAIESGISLSQDVKQLDGAEGQAQKSSLKEDSEAGSDTPQLVRLPSHRAHRRR